MYQVFQAIFEHSLFNTLPNIAGGRVSIAKRHKHYCSQTLYLQTTHAQNLIVSVTQESGCSLAGCFLTDLHCL